MLSCETVGRVMSGNLVMYFIWHYQNDVIFKGVRINPYAFIDRWKSSIEICILIGFLPLGIRTFQIHVKFHVQSQLLCWYHTWEDHVAVLCHLRLEVCCYTTLLFLVAGTLKFLHCGCPLVAQLLQFGEASIWYLRIICIKSSLHYMICKSSLLSWKVSIIPFGVF